MMDSPASASFWTALAQREVWRAALPVGLFVGVLQIALNHGDHWLAGDITPGVIFKTVATPLISLSVALVSAARKSKQDSSHE